MRVCQSVKCSFSLRLLASALPRPASHMASYTWGAQGLAPQAFYSYLHQRERQNIVYPEALTLE